MIVELRVKYLTILKSIYWSKFEKGMMNSDSVIVLMESADTELDEDQTPISDWEDIETLIGDSNVSWLEMKMINLPLIGTWVKNKQVYKITTSYEIIVNFIESHEQTQQLLLKIFQDKKYANIIVEEGRKQCREAEEYNLNTIEAVFPEVCKSIQVRRAKYSLLVKENQNIDSMLHYG